MKEIKIKALEIEPKIQRKTKQIHLSLKEANYNKLKKLSEQSNRAMNDLVNCIIEQM